LKDLSIELFDMTLPSPLVVAGGAPGSRSGEEIIQAAKLGAGAVITEGVGPKGCLTPRPWLAYIGGGLLNSTSFSELTEEDWFKKELPKAKKAKIPIIVGIDARFGIEALQKTTRGATEAGADILYCAANDPTQGPPHVKMIKEETNLPVVIKLGFHNAMEKIGKPIESAGADGIIAIDGPWGMRINTETGKPVVGGLAGIGHISGYPILPMSIYSIYLLSRTTSIPIVGGGGVHNGQDMAEMMMAGAVGASTCSELILGGGLPRITTLLQELNTVIEFHGLSAARELTGMTVDFLKKRKPADLVTDPIPPTIDPDKCTACGDCARGCAWNAITIEDIADIDESTCVGCALCVSVCPEKAISLDYWDPVRSDHQPIQWR
jgi:dihydroorotate dehydrogenase/Pyruvate/2-oxoacid:ferredoxin oxidoreductase delta subunit